MGEMKVIISEDMEKLFRKIAMRRFGYQKGSISEAAAEAFKQWASSYDDSNNEDISWISLKGILKNVKKDSVGLQHEAWKKIGKKYANRR
jgi:hypothetical protein